MGQFKYSKGEQEINKVIKYNQDLSEEIQRDMENTRKNADKSIAESEALLRSLGMGTEVDAALKEAKSVAATKGYENKPEMQPWEDIIKEADDRYLEPIQLENILTPEEINLAFAEAEKINQEFSRQTSIINKTDLAFLMIATALQVAKSLIFPYVAEKFDYGKGVDPEKRLAHNDKSIEKAHREANDKFKNRHIEKHGAGKWINILYNTVPYDITKGSTDLGINMGGRYHRMYTLGHDPILGWLFGTANILTDCITFNTLKTNRVSRVDPITGGQKMWITPEGVPLGSMFRESYDIIKADYLNLPAAIFAQAQHLKSDKYTKVGLPVPILPTINENFASKLYRENYDALCFGRDLKIIGVSFIVSKFIDIIISLTHGLFNKDNEKQELYEVKTRKILLISNVIASTSTVINALITENPKNLDIGSLLNTVTHLWTDIRFITKIKKEFIESEIQKKFQKEIDDLDEMYNAML